MCTAYGASAAYAFARDEDTERPIPARPLPNRLLESSDRLEVVVQDVRPSGHDVPQRRLVPVEVGDEHLDAHARHALPKLPDRLREDVRAAVGQVVAGDRGHHDVLQPEARDRLGDPARLVVVEPGRPAGLDVAEPAGAGARVAEDHDRGGALVPALADVRAVGLLADRVEVQAAEQALEVVVVLAGGQLRADPVGVATKGVRPVRRPTERAAAHRDRDRLGGAVVAAAGPPPPPLGSKIGSSRCMVSECRRDPASASNVSLRPSSRSRGCQSSSWTARSFDAQ